MVITSANMKQTVKKEVQHGKHLTLSSWGSGLSSHHLQKKPEEPVAELCGDKVNKVFQNVIDLKESSREEPHQ